MHKCLFLYKKVLFSIQNDCFVGTRVFAGGLPLLGGYGTLALLKIKYYQTNKKKLSRTAIRGS